LTEPGLFDYLLVNTDLEATFQELVRIAQRVVKGLPPEPGMLPDKTLLEKLVRAGVGRDGRWSRACPAHPTCIPSKETSLNAIPLDLMHEVVLSLLS
jgi:hypothetical protein